LIRIERGEYGTNDKPIDMREFCLVLTEPEIEDLHPTLVVESDIVCMRRSRICLFLLTGRAWRIQFASDYSRKMRRKPREKKEVRKKRLFRSARGLVRMFSAYPSKSRIEKGDGSSGSTSRKFKYRCEILLTTCEAFSKIKLTGFQVAENDVELMQVSDRASNILRNDKSLQEEGLQNDRLGGTTS